MTMELYNYAGFFADNVREIARTLLDQKIYLHEYRHVPGGVFDDEGKTLSVKDEMKVFVDIFAEIKKKYP